MVDDSGMIMAVKTMVWVQNLDGREIQEIQEGRYIGMYGDGSSGGSGVFQSTFLVGDGFGVFRGEFLVGGCCVIETNKIFWCKTIFTIRNCLLISVLIL